MGNLWGILRDICGVDAKLVRIYEKSRKKGLTWWGSCDIMGEV